MKFHLPATLGATLLIVAATTLTAQEQSKPAPQGESKPASPETSTAAAPETSKPAAKESSKTPTIELAGCVSLSPESGGKYAFVDNASGGTYRLNGKNLKKYAGQQVRIVGDPSPKGFRIRTGLWPSPNIAAQAGALDPAQESIARASAGAAGVPDATPELRVVRVHGVDGACR